MEQFKAQFGKNIEEFDTIKRATENLSIETKKNYYYHLAPYFIFLKQNPDTVIATRKSDLFDGNIENEERYERLTKQFVNSMLDRGFTGRSIQGILGNIQGFYKNNSKRLGLDLGRLRLPKARKYRKFSPENKDVRILYNWAESARDKFIIAVMFQNGFSPVDVAALQIGDYPTEPYVYFERSRSKTGEVIRGVSMPDACEQLKLYMAKLDAKSGPLLRGREGPFDNKSISTLVMRLIESVPDFANIQGFKPTALRDGFEDALRAAKIYPKTKEAMMGHSSDIEQEYGGYRQMMNSFVEAAKTVYPYLCLTDAGSVRGFEGFSLDELKEIKNMLFAFRERGKEAFKG